MPDSFGARLRQRREQNGIDLIAIAAQTKIKASFLDGLERDDISNWPSGIFRRAYIRAYAQSIGLAPDAVVREFQEVHPEPAEVATPEAIASALDARGTSGPPTRLRFIVGSALGSLARLRRTSADAASLESSSVDEAHPVAVVPHSPAPRVSRDTQAIEAAAYPADRDTAGPADHEPMNGSPVREAASVADRSPSPVPEDTAPDWTAVAELCLRLSRVETTNQIQPLLQEAAKLLDASGLIVWIWNADAGALTAALAHGYSDRVIAQLPEVGQNEDNATAAAFRTGRTCCFAGSEHAGGALTLPLLTPSGCGGVLAIELTNGREMHGSVRAAATILAALLAQLLGSSRPADIPVDPDEGAGQVADVAPLVRRAAAHR